MIRSTYRNMMLILLVVCFGIAFYVFRWSQDFQLQIAERRNDITRLNQELENARSLDVALTELDNLTITEQTATQLDILRHLGLEQSELNFQMESRDVQAVAATNLYIHNVRISGAMSYEAALALSDRLQNTKKIVLTSIEILAPAADTSDITLNVSGRIYGLDKTIPEPGTLPTAPEPASVETPAITSDTAPAATSAPVTSPTEVSQ